MLMFAACGSGDLALVRRLLKAATTATTATIGGSLPLCIAAQYGHVAVARLLLEVALSAAMTACAGGYLPLYLATQTGSEVVVRLLLP